MDTLKQEAIKVISTLPDTAGLDDIMYKLYVIYKINRGEEAIRRGETVSVDQLKQEVNSW